MNYRLLAINIDGTLLRPNGRLQSETKQAIDFVKRKGVYVTLITRRNFSSAKKIAKALQLNSILVTQNGAFIASNIQQPLYVKRISEEKAFNIVQVLENYNCGIRLHHEKYSVGNRIQGPGNLIARAVFGSGDTDFYPIQYVDSLGDSLRDQPISPTKIDVHPQDKEEQAAIEKTISEHFDGVTVVKDEKKLIITANGVSKLQGLKILCDHLNIPLQKTVAIGDSEDDIEMIKAAGLGVAMWNAPKQVKLAADWVTRSNNMNGVAYMVKEHFRKQQRFEFLEKIKK